MIKTFKASNGSTSVFGNLQMQPVIDAVKQQSTTSNPSTAVGSPSAAESMMNVQAVAVADDTSIVKDTTLTAVATSISSDKSFVLSSTKSATNVVQPSFSKGPVVAAVELAQKGPSSLPTKQYSPYELLTGIVKERPEIVMLTSFLPLFKHDVATTEQQSLATLDDAGIDPYFTDAGVFADAQVQIRALIHANAAQTLKSSKGGGPAFGQASAKREAEFYTNIIALKDMSEFLLGLVRGFDALKAKLDLRDAIHTVKPKSVAKVLSKPKAKVLSKPTQNDATKLQDALFAVIAQDMPDQFTTSDALIKFGYRSDAIKNKFSSTKIWMQLLIELSQLLRHHSLQMIDAEPVAQRSDVNPVAFVVDGTTRFGLRQQLPKLPTLNELINTPPKLIHASTLLIDQAWDVIYNNVNFKSNEARVATLLNFVSKEFRFSSGLARKDVQKTLSERFNYTVQSSDNDLVFDSVIGVPGTNVTDVPTTSDGSLVSIAQRQVAVNAAVLTFESKYVDGDTGTLTPGGTYYIDSALLTDGKSFDTSRVDELSNDLERAANAFSTVIQGLNVLAVSNTDAFDKQNAQFSTVLSDPRAFAEMLAKQMIDPSNGYTIPNVWNDPLAAVFSAAAFNERLRSSLYMYTMARTLKSSVTIPFFKEEVTSPQSVQLTNALADEVLNALDKFVQQKVLTKPTKTTTLSITRDALRSALKSGTYTTKMFESIMQKVVSAFNAGGNKALVDKKTRYGGHSDTVLSMIMFDALIYMFSRFSNVTVSSKGTSAVSTTKTMATFDIVKFQGVSVLASYSNITNRLKNELALTHSTVYTVFNTMNVIMDALRGHSNYLKSKSAVEKLNTLSLIVNDRDALNMLLSEQQIMLLASTVRDIAEAAAAPTVSSSGGDIDSDNDIDVDDELKLLDDTLITQKLRDALFGLCRTDEYSSKKGYNKRVLTVGIPLGFTRLLKERVNAASLSKTSLVDKQSDIINVVVYKVDVQHSDIVYKPKRFMFEMSRFPVRNNHEIGTVPKKPSIDDVIRAVPLRDFDQSNTSAYTTRWAPQGASIPNGVKQMFSDATYSFLSELEKYDIARNHVISYLLESYIMLMTGVGVGDHNFDLVEPPRQIDDEYADLITTQALASLVKKILAGSTSNASQQQKKLKSPSGGVMFSTTNEQLLKLNNDSNNTTTKPVSATAPQSKQASLAQITHRSSSAALHELRSVATLTRVLSKLSSPLSVSKKLLMPKQFDRVFNVVVDPDEFEIDYDKTVATPHGKQALELLIKNGDVVSINEPLYLSKAVSQALSKVSTSKVTIGRHFPQGKASKVGPLFKFRDRNKTSGDLALEKYFVVIETYGEDSV